MGILAIKKTKVTLMRVLEAVGEDNNLGFCTECGAEAFDCEPDAQNYECENCGANKVFGAEYLLLRMV